MRCVLVGVVVLIIVLFVLIGCMKLILGIVVKVGGVGVLCNNNFQECYFNLFKECEVLIIDILVKIVGVDLFDIQSMFVGVICWWQVVNLVGLIDIIWFWFEQGSLSNECKVVEGLKYQVEICVIQGVDLIVMWMGDFNGVCGVVSDVVGVVGWWVNFQVFGIDVCGQVIKLMELMLVINVQCWVRWECGCECVQLYGINGVLGYRYVCLWVWLFLKGSMWLMVCGVRVFLLWYVKVDQCGIFWFDVCLVFGDVQYGDF